MNAFAGNTTTFIKIKLPALAAVDDNHYVVWTAEKTGVTYLNGDKVKVKDAYEANTTDHKIFETEDVSGTEVRIIGYGFTGTTDLVIPSTLQGKTVVEIGANAFDSHSLIGNVTIPNTVEVIGAEALRTTT